MQQSALNPKGRGASYNPANRFDLIELAPDGDALDAGDIQAGQPTQYFRDATRSLLSKNESPDIPFSYSMNPYRGCEHGCVYCYARPMHEYLGFSSGLDFESKILVKDRAPELLRGELMKPSWKPQVISLSGATDAYQPIEKRLGITRKCLQVLVEFKNPVGIVTKNHLVTRDIDLLQQLAAENAAMVNITLTTLDSRLAGNMEPRASQPARRLQAIEKLTKAGIPCGVMVAPVVPGLTEPEIPAILQSARDAGAITAGYIVLKLPHAVDEIFEDWLFRHYPDRRNKIMNRVRHMRGGKTHDARFGKRMTGEGVFAKEVATMFRLGCKRVGLNTKGLPLSTKAFSRPGPRQMNLF